MFLMLVIAGSSSVKTALFDRLSAEAYACGGMGTSVIFLKIIVVTIANSNDNASVSLLLDSG